MTNAVITNIEALPNELQASILYFTGQSTYARVSKHWQNVQMINFNSLRNTYSQNPKIRKFMPTKDRPEPAIECSEILRQTVANVRDYYRKFSGVQPDGFSRTSLIEACDLAELINEADDKNLVTLWNHLPPDIIQQLAALTPYPELNNATNAQIASAIRNGLRNNRAAIQAVLSQVTQLSLRSQGLSELSPEIGLFVNLQTLDLSENQITSLPAEIGHLVNLTQLDLYHNQITSLPAEIGHLVNLQTLDLSENQITSLPAEIVHLIHLQTLNLHHNQITSFPPEIVHLIHLQTLNLHHNQITSLPPEIVHVIHLQTLDLSHNQITSLPAEIGHLVNLTQLDLPHNQITSLPAEIGHLINLTQLDLYHNQITTLPAEISHLVNLQTLDLSHNQITSFPPEIGHLVNLTWLDLRTNNLSYAARPIVAFYYIQNPARSILLDPLFFNSSIPRNLCIGVLAGAAASLGVFSVYGYLNPAQ